MAKNVATDVFRYINMHGGDQSKCWEWKKPLKEGKRPYFNLDGRRLAAYRLVYELHTGEELEPSTLIRHQCDNPICCNPYHLQTGTHQENMEDMKSRERHGLPHHAVRAIRNARAQGVSQAECARMFGVSRETISGIDTGRYYSHVGEEEDEA